MKLLIIILIAMINLYAKKDFYYSFIDSDLTQISDAKKDKIVDGNNRIKTIKRYVKEGKLSLALKEIEIFKHSNKLEVLTSDILLLNSQILYKLESKKRAVEALDVLETAVNES